MQIYRSVSDLASNKVTAAGVHADLEERSVSDLASNKVTAVIVSYCY